jgi:hypothetical protein
MVLISAYEGDNIAFIAFKENIPLFMEKYDIIFLLFIRREYNV